MIQAPVRGMLARVLQEWRLRLARLARLDERQVMSPAVRVRFTWPVLVFFFCAVVVSAVQMWQQVIPQLRPPLLPEALFFSALAAVALSQATHSHRSTIVYSLLAITLCVLLDVITRADWGSVVLYGVIVTSAYRLSPRVGTPLAVLCALIILTSDGLVRLFIARGHVNGSVLIADLLTIGFAYVATLAQRSRHLLIRRLEATQAQLREEMDRAAELAAARERARIARDVHDVLAHSLTVLSVQVQALRQLVRSHPERASAILDQMAEVLRESQVESRQIVGLLREAMTDTDEGRDIDAATRLRVTAERFAERTGVRCMLREHGSPAPLSAQRIETLRFALQEALTNAYPHGKASHAEADLWWEDMTVRLTVRDGGAPSPVAILVASEGSGNGLRGMRERAEALGGSVSAGPRTAGGFAVGVLLPLNATSGARGAQPPTQTIKPNDATQIPGSNGDATV